MNKYLALQKDVFDISKVTVVGSPTITSDGILSNCSNGNAVNTKVQLSQLKGKSWTIKGSVVLGERNHILVKLSSVGNTNYITVGCVQWLVSLKCICFYGRTGIAGDTNNEGRHITGSSTFEIGDKVYYTLTFDITTGTYSLYADKVDGTTYQGQWTPSTDNKELYYINTQPSYYISLGSGSDGEAYLTTGSIDLKQFKIYVDNQLIYTPTKPTYLLERRKPKVWNKGQFTVVGNPSITNDGVMNVDGGANCVKTTKTFNLSEANSWDITTPIFVLSENRTSNASIIGADGIQDGLDIFVRASGQIQWMLFDAIGGASIFIRGLNSSYLNPSIPYQLKYKFTGSRYVLLLSTNGGEFIEIDSVESSTKTNINSQIFIGFRGNTGFNGSINLKSFKIYTDNNLVFDGGADTYVYDPSKFTVVGSPTITEYGVASGFLQNSKTYVQLFGQGEFDFSKPWQLDCKINTGNIFAQDGYTHWLLSALSETTRNIVLGLATDGAIQIYLSSDGTKFFITRLKGLAKLNSPNTDYYIRIIYDLEKYVIQYSTDGIIYYTDITVENSLPLYNGGLKFGNNESNSNSFQGGSVYLPYTSLISNGKEAFTGAKEQFYMLNGI